MSKGDRLQCPQCGSIRYTLNNACENCSAQVHMIPAHWTDGHIKFDHNTLEWVGYDESGLEYCRSKRYFDVRDSLVIYDQEVLQ